MKMRHFNVYTVDENGPLDNITPRIEESKILEILQDNWDDRAQVIFVETFDPESDDEIFASRDKNKK